jgi:preprotein translocase subunit SecG
MDTVLLVIHLFLALALIGVVLLQRSEGGGLGIGSSGGMGSFMSVRGTANLLTRTTAILAAAFMATSLALALLAGHSNKPRSLFDTPAPVSNPQPAPAGQAPAAPAPGSTAPAPGQQPTGQAPATNQAPATPPQPQQQAPSVPLSR